MAKPQPHPRKQLRHPRPQQKKKKKKRRSLLPPRHLLHLPVLRRHKSRKTKKPVPHPSSARSPASTASISRKFAAPDSAAASPSRTSWPSSSNRDHNPLVCERTRRGRMHSSVPPSEARRPHSRRHQRRHRRPVPPLPRPIPATWSA